MPKNDNNLPPVDRVVLRLRNGSRRVVDPADVYFLDASRGDTRVRMRGKNELIDVRRLDEIVAQFEPWGFLRIHRSYMVNLRRIREVRPRGRDWELKLDPPVNRVLPVSRDAADSLFKRLGGR